MKVFYILTLFSCPVDVTNCDYLDYLPVKTQSYNTEVKCHSVGKTLVDAGEVIDYSCHRHEGESEVAAM